MLAIEGFIPGRKYLFSIDYVLNNIAPWDIPDCWGSEECDGYCENKFEFAMKRRDFAQAWKYLLLHKTFDEQYPYIVESLRLYGWRECPTVKNARQVLEPSRFEGDRHVPEVYGPGTELSHGDGHHRLAAAIELGMTHIEYRVADAGLYGDLVRSDSGYESPDYWEDVVTPADVERIRAALDSQVRSEVL